MVPYWLAWILALGCLALPTWAEHAALVTTTAEEYLTCARPFHEIGGHCLLVDDLLKGTWVETAKVCNDLHSHLVNLKDANLLAALADYMTENGLGDRSYWVGANDVHEEGTWVWSDGDPVRMYTPLWGDDMDQIQQPTGGEAEDCGVMMLLDHWFLHDRPCTDINAIICEKGDGLTMYQHDRNTRNTTDCPQPYQSIGGQCLFVNPFGTNEWADMRLYCQAMGGDMVKLDDANLLGDIYDHLTTTEGMGDVYYWIGAKAQQGTWVWLDGTPVTMGTPFWGDGYPGIQAPDGGEGNDCAYLKPTDHFFFNDDQCDGDKTHAFGVICQYHG